MKLSFILLLGIGYGDDDKAGNDCDLNNKEDGFHHIKTGPYNNGTDVGFYSKFEIDYFNTFKVIKNLATQQNLGLYCSGSNIPLHSEELKVSRWIEIPISKVGSLDRPSIAWLELLGLEKTIVAVGEPDSITSPCTKEQFKTNPPTTLTNSDTASDLDLIFTTGSTQLEDWVKNKSVHMSYNEVQESPLNRAQWIHVVAAFFNMEKEAYKLYEIMLNNYQCYTNNFKHLSHKPELTVINKINEDWNLLQNEGWVDLATGAGGYLSHVTPPSDKNVPISKLLDFLNDIDNIIDISEESDQDLNKLDPDNIIKPTGRSSGSVRDWDETSVTRPDLVIEDLINSIFPTYNKSYTSRWFVRSNQSANKIPSCQLGSFESSQCKLVPNGFSSIGENGPIERKVNEDVTSNPGRVIGILLGTLITIFIAAFIGYILYRRHITSGVPITIHQLKRKSPTTNEDQINLLPSNRS